MAAGCLKLDSESDQKENKGFFGHGPITPYSKVAVIRISRSVLISIGVKSVVEYP